MISHDNDDDDPNPQIRRALTSVREKATADARLSRRLGTCLDSLSKYPLPLEASQCLLLEGFNCQVVTMLEREMRGEGEQQPRKGLSTGRESLSPITKRFRCVGDRVRKNEEEEEKAERKRRKKEQQEREDYRLALSLQALERRQEENLLPSLAAAGRKPLSSNFVDPDGDEEEKEEDEEGGLLTRLLSLPTPPRPNVTAAASSVTVTPPPPPPSSSSLRRSTSLTGKESKKKTGQNSIFDDDPVFRNITAALANEEREEEEEEEEGVPSKSSLSSSERGGKKMVQKPSASSGVHTISSSEDEEEVEPVPGPSGAAAVRGTSEGEGEESRQKKSRAAKKVSKAGERRKREKEEAARKRQKKKEEEEGVAILDDLPSWTVEALAREEEEEEVEAVRERPTPEFRLLSGQFEVVLLVDTCEVAGGEQGGRKNRKALTAKELARRGVRHEVRKLNVGDFAWVARPREGGGSGGSGGGVDCRELVLPHVVERKRVDDLLSSIRDKRYKEQKWRLARCGVPNVIYLVEEFAKCLSQKFGGNLSAKDTALISTACTKGFSVKQTRNQNESITFLASMTSLLEDVYLHRTLSSCTKEDQESGLVKDPETTLITFKEFYVNSRKSPVLSTKDVFIRMLMQQKCVTHSSASAIADLYPSLGHLVRAYRDLCSTEEERGDLLAGVRHDGGRKKVGRATSRAIATLYDHRVMRIR